jgi:hypothetical protein
LIVCETICRQHTGLTCCMMDSSGPDAERWPSCPNWSALRSLNA